MAGTASVAASTSAAAVEASVQRAWTATARSLAETQAQTGSSVVYWFRRALAERRCSSTPREGSFAERRVDLVESARGQNEIDCVAFIDRERSFECLSRFAGSSKRVQSQAVFDAPPHVRRIGRSTLFDRRRRGLDSSRSAELKARTIGRRVSLSRRSGAMRASFRPA